MNEAPTRIRWRVLGVVFGLSFVAYLLRLNLSIVAVVAMPELGISQVQMGWVFASFLWAYALFQLPGGLWGQRVGPRRALTLIAAAWTVTTLATAAVPGPRLAATAVSLGALVALRFATGVAQAPLFPVVAASIERWFPPGRWALPNALSSTGLALGGAAAAPLISWLMLAFGWRTALIITAPAGLLGAWAWWRIARDGPGEHPAVNPEEAALIEAGRCDGDSEATTSWRRLMANRDVLLISASYLCMNYVFYLFFNWFYLYLVDVRGFGLLQSGFLASLPWLVGAAMAIVGGEGCDRLCARIGPLGGCRVPAVAGLLLVAVCLLAGVRTTSAPWAILFLTLCFGFTQATEGAYWSGMTCVAGRQTAPATGLLNMAGNLGGAISSPVVPLLVAWFGWETALASGSIMAVAAATLWLPVRARGRGAATLRAATRDARSESDRRAEARRSRGTARR